MKDEFIHGDCMDVMRGIDEPQIFDCTITDIPYDHVNTKQEEGDDGVRSLRKGEADELNFDLHEFCELVAHLTSGSVYIFCEIAQFPIIWDFFENESDGWHARHLVWSKTNPSPMHGQNMWLSGHENLVFAKRSGALFNGHCEHSVIREKAGSSKRHPTEKPLSLWYKFIHTSTSVGDWIFDPCMGSGTTGVAAIRTDRHWTGVEKHDEYYHTALERIEVERSQRRLL